MKFVHDICRYLVPRIPFGKTTLINIALKLAGNTYGGVIEMEDGRKFFIDDINSGNRKVFFSGEYEPKTTEVIRRFLKPGMIAIDVGANIGWFTTVMAEGVGDSGQVYAFDISERSNRLLTETVKCNRFANVTIERIALGDRVGTSEFFDSPVQGTANLKRELVSAGSRKSVVPTTTLDAYLLDHGIGSVDLIKCDIDGAELLFIDGASHALRSLPAMVIEIADQAQHTFGRSAVELMSRLQGIGYALYDIERGCVEVHVEDAESVNDTNILCIAPGRRV